MNLHTFFDRMIPFLVYIVSLYWIILVLCGLDLRAGIQKAKLRGEFRTSEGYRRTVYKLSRYFNFLLAVTLVDGIQMLTVHYFSTYYNLIMFPFFTSAIAILIGVIEVISIHEKAEDKEKMEMARAARLAGEILANQNLREIIGNVNNFIGDKRINNTHEEDL